MAPSYICVLCKHVSDVSEKKTQSYKEGIVIFPKYRPWFSKHLLQSLRYLNLLAPSKTFNPSLLFNLFTYAYTFANIMFYFQ